MFRRAIARNPRGLFWILGLALMVLSGGWLAGCGSDDTTKPKLTTGTCEDCHRSAERLQATATAEEDSTNGDSGEG